MFSKIKAEGKTSSNPLKESFGHRYNFKFVLLALFGATMGQGVIWYTGQFYAMSFIGKVCSVAGEQTDTLMAIALMAATPFFVIFGGLSDRFGRKWIMLAGILIPIVSYRPIYQKIYKITDVSHKTELTQKINTVRSASLLPGSVTDSLIKTTTDHYYADGSTLQTVNKDSLLNGTIHPVKEVKKTIHINDHAYWMLVLLVFIQVIFVTMVYGPIAAFLVELFPARIRYTSMSLPYHVGNGIFGGLLPAVSACLVSSAHERGEMNWYLNGLWYPILIGLLCFLIGAIYINGKDNRIND